jgi:hypothetical protein
MHYKHLYVMFMHFDIFYFFVQFRIGAVRKRTLSDSNCFSIGYGYGYQN